ncbi:DUF2267 domain-containing protein [Streptomyces sp. NPDC005574]|uniref:DUF2267 domain-containing protein n=1 Tax=Streptomyces sp. NPDC005574 TaxID=3156891 RepID=UPI0033BF110E
MTTTIWPSTTEEGARSGVRPRSADVHDHPHGRDDLAPVSDVSDAGWTRLVDEVRECGLYPTRAAAERVSRTVLSALGGQVTGEERDALARALPREAARLIASQVPAAHPLTAAEFVDAVAARTRSATPATARWDVSSVLGVLPKLVGDDLATRVLSRLPSGYALLFVKAELAPAS